ncbi:MAG: hypothetical protein ACNA8L_02080 [Luteolibacter sp.]|jgi:hypothetical protein
MRTLSLTLNLIVTVFFSGFLGYTFYARPHLNSLAREFVTEETVKYSAPLVDAAEDALESPVVKRLLPKTRAEVIRDEITAYRRDPASFIADLTNQAPLGKVAAPENPMLAKVAGIKAQIRRYYDDTLDDLIRDLRIFSTTNLIVGMLALGFAFFSKSSNHRYGAWLACVMAASVVFCSFMYVDGLSFFHILFRSHTGWWYAVMLLFVIIRIYGEIAWAIASKKNP